jgi:hypothetical protein
MEREHNMRCRDFFGIGIGIGYRPGIDPDPDPDPDPGEFRTGERGGTIETR